jgi:hypothetical protein
MTEETKPAAMPEDAAVSQGPESGPEIPAAPRIGSPDPTRVDSTSQEQPKAEVKETMASIYDLSFPTLKVGEIVTGRIIKKLPTAVLVDLGLKAEGVLSLDEFRNPADVCEGQEVKVCLDAIEDSEGFPAISKRKADFQLAWEQIKQKSESAEGVPPRW